MATNDEKRASFFRSIRQFPDLELRGTITVKVSCACHEFFTVTFGDSAVIFADAQAHLNNAIRGTRQQCLR